MYNMKKEGDIMKKLKQLGLLSLCALLAFSIGGCSKTDVKEEQKKFDAFIEQEFDKSLENSYINAHVFLEHPKNFGIDKSEIKKQIDIHPTDENLAQEKKDTEETRKNFKTFNRDKLNKEQKDTYDIFNYTLGITEEANNFAYMHNYFDPSTGMHTQLPTIFADMELRNEEDVKDLITVLEDTKPYIKSLLEYTKKQETYGTLMVDTKSVIEYCQGIIDKNEKSDILSSMNKNIETLKLGDKKTADYEKQLKETFLHAYIPAYKDIVKTMKGLDDSKNNKQGLSHIKNGREYYELLYREATGSEKTIEEMKVALIKLGKKSLENTSTIAKKDDKLYERYMKGEIKSGYNDFESMLKDLNKDFKDDFPAVSELKYDIKPLSKEIANDGIAAYFNIPALDTTSKNQIRVNMQEDKLDIGSLTTFSTVAHEGIPGHMYQINYMYDNLTSDWRKTMPNLLGYTEGYATYVQLYALKYLNIEENVKILDLNTNVYQMCMVSLIDIGIHYDGWSLNDTKKFMQDNELAVEGAEEIYEQLQAMPTSYLSYYAGYLEVMELKDLAQDKLKDKFNDKDFHEAILKSGTAPYGVVKRNVEAYIDAKK